jgi:tRNA A37 threonylcarbamoyladenosine dehydratase
VQTDDKAAIINACVMTGTPVITCGGAGGLVDPTQVSVCDIAHVKDDPLISQVRNPKPYTLNTVIEDEPSISQV